MVMKTLTTETMKTLTPEEMQQISGGSNGGMKFDFGPVFVVKLILFALRMDFGADSPRGQPEA